VRNREELKTNRKGKRCGGIQDWLVGVGREDCFGRVENEK